VAARTNLRGNKHPTLVDVSCCNNITCVTMPLLLHTFTITHDVAMKPVSVDCGCDQVHLCPSADVSISKSIHASLYLEVDSPLPTYTPLIIWTCTS